MNSLRALWLCLPMLAVLGCSGSDECEGLHAPGVVDGRYWAPAGARALVIEGHELTNVTAVRVDSAARIVVIEADTPEGAAVYRFRMAGGG